jgi:tetratricopeptide (TPR) repeat protein
MLFFIGLAAVLSENSARAQQETKQAAVPAVVEQRQERLKERDGYGKETERLRRENKLAEAIAAAEKMLAIERAVFGDIHEDVVGSLQQLAEMHESREEFAAAHKARAEILAIVAKLHGATDWRVGEAQQSLTHLERVARLTPPQRHELAEAEELLKQVSEISAQRRPRDAIPGAERCAAIRQRLLGDGDSDYAVALNWLGSLYDDAGDYARAEPLYRQAAELFKKTLGEYHPAYASNLGRLAVLYQNQGQYARVEPLYLQVAEIRRKAYGENHADYALSLNNLAMLYEAQGDFARAEPLYRRSLEIRKRALGENHPTYARSLNHLGSLYQTVGNYAKAEPLLLQASEICKRVVGENHLEYAYSLYCLANLYKDQGQYAKAAPRFQQAIAIGKRLGEQARIVANSTSGLAAVYEAQGDYARAEPLYLEACEIYKKAAGENHPHYANSLANLAGLYRARGEYARAEPLFQQAMEIDRRALGENHPDYARSLGNLAAIYDDMGDYARAEPLFRQALEIDKHALGEKNPHYATSLDNLATLYQEMGNYAQAEPLYRQALEIRKEALGEKHPDYALSLHNLAILYIKKGDYPAAEPLLRQAMQIRSQVLGETHPDYAKSLNELALFYEDTGDYAQAESLLCQALEVWKQALGERHPHYAKSLNNLALLYQKMGDYAKAESLYGRAMRICEQVQGKRHPDYAISLNNLGSLYDSMGNYAQAEPLFRQALQIGKQVYGEKHPSYAVSLNNLALLYEEMGDYAKAEPLFREALEIDKQALGDTHPHYATDLNNLALLYDSMRDYAKAEPLHRQAMEINKRALGDKHPDYATNLNNLAELYRHMGDFARAEPLCRQALDICKQVEGERHPHYATSLNNLALLYEAMGDYAQAEKLHRQALEIRSQVVGERHPEYAKSLNNLALLKVTVREPREAEPLSRQALAIMRQHLDLTSAVQSERQQLAMIQDTRWFLGNYLSVSMAAGTPAEQVYAEVLASKGAVWTRQQGMRRMRQDPVLAAKPEVAKLYADLEQASRALANLLGARPNLQHPDEYRRKLESTSEEVERLQQALAAASEEYRAKRAQQNRTAADIQKAIPPGTVLVDFLEYDNYEPTEQDANKWIWQRRLAAFVVRPDQPVERLDLGPAAPIQETVEKWRASYSAEEAATLKQLVWKPLQPLLHDAQTVLISPDGALARFPLPALPGEQPGSYLLEELAIGVLPVPQLLPEVTAREPPPLAAPASMLLVGEVDYDAAPGQADMGSIAQAAPRTRGGQPLQWPPLDSTRQEIVSIRDSFDERFPDGRCALLRRDQAVVGRVRAEINRYRYVHFATHGFFAPQETAAASVTGPSPGMIADGASIRRNIVGFHPGLCSGLVLAGANRPAEAGQDDGILTALEVAELDLGQVDLATLSACETGLGKSAAGEGLLGLQRAFQVAGAHSVVATLWTIRDDAGRQLMIDFYENLWAKKMSKVEALRAAQLTMLREGVKRGLDIGPRPADENHRLPPWYWAGFVLSGDWR